jgi:hypothetical protein
MSAPSIRSLRAPAALHGYEAPEAIEETDEALALAVPTLTIRSAAG